MSGKARGRRQQEEYATSIMQDFFEMKELKTKVQKDGNKKKSINAPNVEVMRKNPKPIPIKEEPKKVLVQEVHISSAPNGRDASGEGNKEGSSESLIKSCSTEQQELQKKISNYKKNISSDVDGLPSPDSKSLSSGPGSFLNTKRSKRKKKKK